jgi:hypothetical protein
LEADREPGMACVALTVDCYEGEMRCPAEKRGKERGPLRLLASN